MPWSKKSRAIPLLPSMGRTACTEPQCLYKGELYLFPFPHQVIYYHQHMHSSAVGWCETTNAYFFPCLYDQMFIKCNSNHFKVHRKPSPNKCCLLPTTCRCWHVTYMFFLFPPFLSLDANTITQQSFKEPIFNNTKKSTVIPRLTSDPANEFFG